MKIGIPCEVKKGETRVALVPSMVGELSGLDAQVLVEKGAGSKACFSDQRYQDAGAQVVPDATSLYQQTDVIIKVQPPTFNETLKSHELDLMLEGITLIGFLSPTTNRELVERLLSKRITAFSMELMPRISRAQGMDALSSMSTVAGYKAVLLATQYSGKFFPLLMTAAGTIPPSTVLIIGAGVAGLQAIATAKRLGARVEAFDTRPAVKEQVESLGARFVEMELSKETETDGGYAKEISPEFIKKEMEAIGSRLPKSDVVVSTALVFGKRAPLLITEEMVKTMHEGSVIIDLAAEQGGNCELTQPGEVVQKHGVTICGPINLPSSMPVHASQMYSRNITNLVTHLYQAKNRQLDFTDEITRSCCVCSNGELLSEVVKGAFL
ncbi:MAG: NAD(P) transhydrogenase subunit alpha [Omnitrophica bacterium RIFCSPLOWO2_12_FULL_50_11]|nr:MAG: NAD(P) transhydrogenase subunit alpha [Omnitrophica bacterium RIFCSPLOWO2_12_FULL_50_11]